MESRARTLLFVVLGGTAAVFLLRLLSYGNGGGGAVQLVQQVVMPIPLVIGLAACLSRIRQGWLWAPSALVFLVALPLLLGAWPDIPAESECSASGFVPLAWSEWLEGYTQLVAITAIALLACFGGLAMLVKAQSREPGVWLILAGVSLGVTWFAAPVCVGA